MMVLALFLLAAAMMVSGVAAVLFGSDIIMVERGWAMVISGATSFSAGAVLLGIAALLRAFERFGQEIGARDRPVPREPARRAEPTAPRAEQPSDRAEPAMPEPVVLPGAIVAEPEMLPAPALPHRQPAFAAVAPEPPRPEPVPAPIAPPIELVRSAEPGEERAPELRAERAPEPSPPLPNGSRPLGRSDILVAPDPPRLRIVEPEPASPPTPEPLRPPEPPPVTVVGKYSSGGNSYVMFSDGSIQADTPTGRHRFASLDELKTFVAGGGERS